MRDATFGSAGQAPRARPFDNVRRMWRATVTVTHGRTLSPDALRELSDFRRSIMTMKPDVDLDADFGRFRGFVTRCPIVMCVRDEGGALRGSFVVRWIEGERGGRPWRLVLPEYGFFHPSLRGSPAFPWAALRAMAAHPNVLRGRDVFIGGVGYPTGVLALEGLFAPVQFLSDPHLDDDARHHLERVVTEIAGPRFDAATGRVCMPTLPPRPSARWFRRMAARPTLARYQAQCPDWLDGYALPCVVRVDPRGVVGALGRALARSARARWESEPA
jgi:hypothetical protein